MNLYSGVPAAEKCLHAEVLAQRDYWRNLYYKTVQQLNEVLLKREMGPE